MRVTQRPWPRGSATGLGSVPGTDPLEAARTVFGELPDLPHLAELPDRGAGADMIGRASILLVDLPVQIEPSGWRFTSRPGIDLRRARDFLARDLDALEQVAHSREGAVKVQVAGPLTLAASVELVNGQRAIADHGAVREIAESLTEGLSRHLAGIRSRLPAAALVVQVDEPAVPAVLSARIPTASGYGTLRAVSAQIVQERLATVLAAAEPGHRAVHCCAADAPIGLFRRAGADAVAIEADLLTAAGLDELGEAVDAGVALWLGVVASNGPIPPAAKVADRVARLWGRLGFDPGLLADSIVLTPSCGLAGAAPAEARRVMTVVRQAAERLRES